MISSFLVIEYLIVTMGNFCKIYFNILIVVAAVAVTIIFNYSNNLLYYHDNPSNSHLQERPPQNYGPFNAWIFLLTVDQLSS